MASATAIIAGANAAAGQARPLLTSRAAVTSASAVVANAASETAIVGYPPDSALAYTATPTVTMPTYLQTITDPTYGVEVIRVGQASLRRQAYSSLPAWNADGTLLALSFGSSSNCRMVNGSTFVELYTIGGDTFFAAEDPTLAFRYTSGSNGILVLNATQSSITTTKTIAVGTLGGYDAFRIGGGQGACSDDGRWIAIQWSRVNGAAHDYGIAVVDTNGTGSIYSEITLATNTTISDWPATNPACGISHSGDYVFLENGAQGTGVLAGGWVYARNLAVGTRRQVTQYTRHFDWGWADEAKTIEVVATCSQIAAGGDGVNTYTGYYRADTGAWTVLHSNWPNGHVSGRNSARPGWFYLSHFTAGGTHPGAGTVLAVKASDPSTVEYFGHVHHSTSPGYNGEPQACPSQDGRKVAWASPWTPESAGTIYGFVSGMDVSA